MAAASIRAFCFSTMDAVPGIRYGQRSRALLTSKVDYSPEYNREDHKGHRGKKECIIGNDPTLKVSLTGKVLRLAGTFSSMAPLSAIHKGYFADCYAAIDHGFGVEAATDGYWIGTGKLSSPPGSLHEASVELEWFEPDNEVVTIVAAPSAPA